MKTIFTNPAKIAQIVGVTVLIIVGILMLVEISKTGFNI